jgi:hypothetical protein
LRGFVRKGDQAQRSNPHALHGVCRTFFPHRYAYAPLQTLISLPGLSQLIATRLAWDRILTPGPIGKPDAEPILPSYRRRTSSNESAFPLRSLSASSFESSSSSELSLTLPKQALLDRPRPSYSSSASGGDTCPYFSPSYASSGVSDLVPAYTSQLAVPSPFAFISFPYSSDPS